MKALLQGFAKEVSWTLKTIVFRAGREKFCLSYYIEESSLDSEKLLFRLI